MPSTLGRCVTQYVAMVTQKLAYIVGHISKNLTAKYKTFQSYSWVAPSRN